MENIEESKQSNDDHFWLKIKTYQKSERYIFHVGICCTLVRLFQFLRLLKTNSLDLDNSLKLSYSYFSSDNRVLSKKSDLLDAKE
jgi:hypothetical protein